MSAVTMLFTDPNAASHSICCESKPPEEFPDDEDVSVMASSFSTANTADDDQDVMERSRPRANKDHLRQTKTTLQLLFVEKESFPAPLPKSMTQDSGTPAEKIGLMIETANDQQEGPCATPRPTSSTSGQLSRLPASEDAPKPALKSSLRPGSALKKKVQPSTRRRVRGLWGNDSACLFAQLHDDTALFILSHLSMMDLLSASVVCRRWNHLVSNAKLWRQVDATDFVYSVHDRSKPETAQASTSRMLASCLEKYTPDALSIRHIEHRLSADMFLPTLRTLQELTMTGYADLTDTHVHVMLLSSRTSRTDGRARHKTNALRRLALEQCPLLTNATVRSVASLCCNLEELSLRGNRSITDISPLRCLWTTAQAPIRSSSASGSGLGSLFAPPPQTRKTSSLQSIFAPPSPTGRSIRLSLKEVCDTPGTLCRVDFSNTRVTAESFVKALTSCKGRVQAEKIAMGGSGETWNDNLIRQVSDALDMSRLREWDISCGNIFLGSTEVTDAGLEYLSRGCRLQLVNMAGHKSITGAGVAKLVSAASSRLAGFNLGGCTGICNDSHVSVGRLAKAFSTKTGLQRVSLAHCFANEKQANPEVLLRDELLGRTLIFKGIFHGSLRYLDLTGCWFVTEKDVSMILDRCKLLDLNMGSLRCSGTRYARD